MDIAQHHTVFDEVYGPSLDEAVSRYRADGFAVIGRHRSQPVALLRKGQGEYLLVQSIGNAARPAKGVLVEDVATALAEAWQQPGMDVFDGGKVGAMELRLPAVRMPDGQLVYLVDDTRRTDFFADDFISGAYQC